jgi:hypothetical protein
VNRALIDFSEEDLQTGIRATASHVQYSYSDYVGEINRRASLRQARRSELLSVVAAIVATVSVIISAASVALAR